MPLLRLLLPRTSISTSGVVVLTIISLVMILVQLCLGLSGQSGLYYAAFGISWGGIAQFKIWQFLTYALVHAHWLHLLVNLLMLWVLGGKVMGVFGRERFGVILVAGVLAGGVLHVVVDFLMERAGVEGMTLVGISGGCFALLLALTTMSPNARLWPIPISGRNLGLGVIIAELLLLLMTPALGVPVFSGMGSIVVDLGEGVFVISHACHFGGAVVGCLLARVLAVPYPSLIDLQQARARAESKVGLDDVS